MTDDPIERFTTARPDLPTPKGVRKRLRQVGNATALT